MREQRTQTRTHARTHTRTHPRKQAHTYFMSQLRSMSSHCVALATPGFRMLYSVQTTARRDRAAAARGGQRKFATQHTEGGVTVQLRTTSASEAAISSHARSWLRDSDVLQVLGENRVRVVRPLEQEVEVTQPRLVPGRVRTGRMWQKSNSPHVYHARTVF